MKRSILSFAVMFALLAGCLVSFFGDAQAQSLTLWDGETWTTDFHYGSANNTQAYQGTWCFEGAPDPWHSPGIGLNSLSSWRADVSGYDEVWFYAKANTTGKTLDFSVYAWPNFSKSVNIDPYIVGGGGLTTTYKLVRIPVAALKTVSYPLNSVEILYFGTAKTNAGYKIYIDNVQAVKLVPGVSVSPSSLSFGNVNVGSSGTQTLTMSNPGTATLTVSGITLSGADAGQFSASPTSFSVNPGQGQNVAVTFSPTSAGTGSASLSIAHNAQGSPTNVSLSGSGVGIPAISLSTASLAMDNTSVGSTSQKTFTISNTGTGSLSVTGITVGGTDASQFAASPTTATVAVGGSQMVTVTFAPTSAGTKSASLSIAHDAAGSPSGVSLSGAGAIQQLLWNGETAGATFEYGSANNTQAYQGTWCFEGAPDPWHSPSLGLNGLSAWRMDLSGYDEIQFYARADMTGRTFDFSVYAWPNFSNSVNIDPYIVGGGGLTTTYKLVKIPISALKTASYPLNSVEILYFGVARPTSGHKIYIDDIQAVSLSSTPTPTPTPAPAPAPVYAQSPSSLSFGDVNVGSSGTQTLTVSNTGDATLNITGITVGETDASQFTVSPTTATVSAGGSQTVTVTFAPTSAGTKSASLSIAHDAAGSPSGVSLSGAGAIQQLLWNGETAGATFEYGSANNTQAYQGTWCFEGAPDPWHSPSLGLNGLSAWRMDLSGYDEIQFYARADMTGRTFDFSVYAWPNFSNSVNIDPYIVGGGGLTTAYKLVRIPISALKTSSYSLNSVEILYFGVARPTSGHKIYIDDIQAVSLSSTPAPAPAPAPVASVSPSSLSFGSLNVESSGTQTLTVSNTGDATLNVTGIAVGGTDASQFTVSPTTATVAVGGSQTITVTFAPTSAGTKSASLSIAHDATGSPSGVSLTGDGTTTSPPPPAPAGGVSVTSVTSSTVSIAWAQVSNATGVRVYLAAEPAAVAGGSLPDQKLVATLPGNATSYQFTKLAAAADVFLRVEADTPSGAVSSNAYTRTKGGPRATLDTPLREAHGYAPNVLMIVLENKGTYYNGTGLTGNQGSTWQAGPWTVTRRDGTPIQVSQVHRHTIPVSQPSYQIGFGAPYDDNVVDVDHRIYLVLNGAVGSREVLRITGPLGLDFTLPFSDRYLETPVVQLNQVGYNPKARRRWAYVSGWMGDGGALSLANFPATAEALSEPADANLPRTLAVGGLGIASRSTNDSDAGAEVRQIDLSTVPPAEGARYRVRIPGVGVSWATAVSQAAVSKAFSTVTRGLFYNRWGGDLKPAYTDGIWSRPADHPTIYTAENTNPGADAPFAETTPKTGERPLVGGYHDAGDFDQRPMHSVVAQMLMRAYELNPGAFTDGQLNIPQSGNGIPDLLDEALWGVAGWEQLQESDGGVRSGCDSYRHPWGFYHTDQDPLPYWTFSRDANHTARVAGLFAQAARLVAPYDAARSGALRARAANAYTYAAANGASNANRLYASGELFRLTGDATYKAAFEAAWAAMGTYGAFSNFATAQYWMGDFFNNDRAMPDFILGYLGRADADAGIVSTSQQWLTNYANEAVNSVLNSAHAHRSPRTTSPDWGNGVTTGKFMDTVYARLQMGGLSPSVAQDYFDALSLAADYALGGNPDGLVYFTGLGSRRVEEPLHLDALSFIKEGKGPIPGIPVYGPVSDLSTAPYYSPGNAAFYPSFSLHPLMRRYGDIRTFVITNEFTVWESQASHAEHFAALMGLGATGGAAKPATPLPIPLPHPSTSLRTGRERGSEQEAGLTFGLDQNTPNPFNPSTTIRYRLAEASGVRLVVYNLLGQRVRVLVDAAQGPGVHSIQWDGRDAAGRQVATGLYIYRLEAGGFSQVRKMLFAK